MKSPLKIIIDWYNSLPIEHRFEVAMLLGGAVPYYSVRFPSDDQESEIAEFLRYLDASLSSKHKEVGMVLMLKSMIEFFFIKSRSDKNEWKSTKIKMDQLAKELDSDSLREENIKIEFRAHQWVTTCSKWNEIIKYMQDDYLNDYYFSN